MRILIIEDDKETANYLLSGFREVGHVVDHAPDGKVGLYLCAEQHYDFIILDRMLPYVDGLTVLSTIRACGNKTPVLILSALAQVDERVKGLKAGGDDYIVKPFSFTELLARIEAVMRRGDTDATQILLRVGGLEMHLRSRKVTREGKEIPLKDREFKLLEYLMRHSEQVVTRTMLLENVWDFHFDPQTNVIDVQISRLRQKIDKGFKQSLLHTVRGAGYKLSASD